jgi:hypothetical protein
MRSETCLTCRVTAEPALLLAEMLSASHHHHHTMLCEQCGAGWFEDPVPGAFGQPVPARRDTTLCPCPEDDRPRYTPSVMLIPWSEAECRCGPKELALQPWTGRRRH